MRIRNKLLLASAIPIALFIVQIVVVGVLIRELQKAVEFVAAAQTTIESSFDASSQVNLLQIEVRKLPSLFSNPQGAEVNIIDPWTQLEIYLDKTLGSSAAPAINQQTLTNINTRIEIAKSEIENTLELLDNESANLDNLIERAIFTNDALLRLDNSLASLTLDLRQQLQSAVDKEKDIHNLPLIAGSMIGSLAVAISIILVWRFVDSGISRRLTELNASMMAIASGDLQTHIPQQHSVDEIGDMTGALKIFRDNALEIEQSNLRENEHSRFQRQYWLEHMASFLRHELKNKQVGAEQSINLLLKKAGDNADVQKYCNRASRSLTDMKELINGTVHAADIESALLSEQFSQITVNGFLTEYVESLVIQGIENVVYERRAPADCYLIGDRIRLVQMLDKIVSNADDFRIINTNIIIGSDIKEQKILIHVENQGPEIPANNRFLFDLSVTARDAVRNHQNNVGFGLFVALRIAEYHGGSIDAANTGNGVVFTVGLPVNLPDLVLA